LSKYVFDQDFTGYGCVIRVDYIGILVGTKHHPNRDGHVRIHRSPIADEVADPQKHNNEAFFERAVPGTTIIPAVISDEH